MSEITTKDINKASALETKEKVRKSGLAVDKFIPFIAVVALFIVFSVTAKNFFTVRSVLTLALQTSAITIMGIGVTFT
ncbi:MAG: hypothetical protein AB1649_27020, partial [Chloroflexota bacterium]